MTNYHQMLLDLIGTVEPLLCDTSYKGTQTFVLAKRSILIHSLYLLRGHFSLFPGCPPDEGSTVYSIDSYKRPRSLLQTRYHKRRFKIVVGRLFFKLIKGHIQYGLLMERWQKSENMCTDLPRKKSCMNWIELHKSLISLLSTTHSIAFSSFIPIFFYRNVPNKRSSLFKRQGGGR